MGLGRRPLLAVVGHRPADRHVHRHLQLQGVAVRCLQHGPALPDRAVRTQHPGAARPARRLVRRLLGREQPRDPALRLLSAEYHRPPATTGHGIQRQERAPGRHAGHQRHRAGDLGWCRLQRPARLPSVAAPRHPVDPGGLHRPGEQLQPGGRPSPVAVRQLPVAEPGADARQEPRGGRGRTARQGPAGSRSAAPGAAQGDSGQPTEQHPGGRAHQRPPPRRADRHVRAQGVDYRIDSG